MIATYVCIYTRDRQGPRYAFLAGPFRTPTAANAEKRRAVKLAYDLSPVTELRSNGSCLADVEAEREKMAPGVLNERLGLKLDAEGYVAPCVSRETGDN